MSNFEVRRRVLARRELSRRRLLQATAGAGIASGLIGSTGMIRAQEITFSRDYEGTTLNLLMEDLLETTIIEEMLPEFTELTGITVNFEKVAYPVMHEKLVPQLAAGPGNGSYDVWRSISTGSTSSPAPAGSRISGRGSPIRAGRSISPATSRPCWTSARPSTARPTTSRCSPTRWVSSTARISSTTRRSRPRTRSRPETSWHCPTASRATSRWPRPSRRWSRICTARRCRRSRSTRS